MTFDLERILSSKRVNRERMTVLPIGEKLRMLDTLREREVAIRRQVPSSETHTNRGGEATVPHPRFETG
ncbi:MAG: hypothetical protein M3Z05_07535 [Gemmatimonadota bacterium]|nr:hypothetical protein [Gemmatimonadota bacterium]